MDLPLEEIVLFEIPGRNRAEAFFRFITADRSAWLERGDTVAVIGAFLNPDWRDLAVLLRRVQSWLDGGSGLPALRYEVDGRTYILEANTRVLVPS